MIKPGNKLRWIRSLMIFSQALLLCFMAYWLYAEYYGEQEKLRKDLTRQLERSQDRVVDSTLMTSLHGFIAEEGTKASIAMKRSRGDVVYERLLPEDSTIVAELEKQLADTSWRRRQPRERRIIYYQKEIEKLPDGGSKVGERVRPASGEIAARAFRTFIRNTKDMPVELRDQFLRTDTGTLIKGFQKDLRSSGLHVHTRWISRSDVGQERHIYLSSLSTPGYQLEVSGFRNILLRQMIPQALITVFLLSLTALAFMVTYKSLRAQMQLAAIRNDFISNMSHELKTPVSTVKVALEAVSEPEVLSDLPTARDYIRMATLELNRLELLVNQALQSSLLEEGRIQMQLEPVDLHAVTTELLAALQPRFSQRGATVSMEVSGGSFTVPADKLQVQGVLINILDNALKYAGADPVIRIRLEDAADGAHISITDNGPGIPEAYAGRIFDKFFRVPRGNEHSVKGYGLGLSYAAQVMKAHNGRIAMQPAPGGGCSFRLHFKSEAA